MKNLEYYTKKTDGMLWDSQCETDLFDGKIKLLTFLLNLERAGHIFALTDMQDGLEMKKSVIISYGRLQNLLRLIFVILIWRK